MRTFVHRQQVQREALWHADVVPQGAGEGALSVSGVGLSSYTALAGVGQGWGGQWHLLSGEISCYPSSKCL